MLYYLKWIREHRDREIEQLISANSWYNTVLWLVSKSQTVLWFADLNLLKEELQGCDKQTNKQIDLIDCWTASFAVKNVFKLPFLTYLIFYRIFLLPHSSSSISEWSPLCHWDDEWPARGHQGDQQEDGHGNQALKYDFTQ